MVDLDEFQLLCRGKNSQTMMVFHIVPVLRFLDIVIYQLMMRYAFVSLTGHQVNEQA